MIKILLICVALFLLFGCAKPEMPYQDLPINVKPMFTDETNRVACYYLKRGDHISLSCVGIK